MKLIDIIIKLISLLPQYGIDAVIYKDELVNDILKDMPEQDNGFGILPKKI